MNKLTESKFRDALLAFLKTGKLDDIYNIECIISFEDQEKVYYFLNYNISGENYYYMGRRFILLSKSTQCAGEIKILLPNESITIKL